MIRCDKRGNCPHEMKMHVQLVCSLLIQKEIMQVIKLKWGLIIISVRARNYELNLKFKECTNQDK